MSVMVDHIFASTSVNPYLVLLRGDETMQTPRLRWVLMVDWYVLIYRAPRIVRPPGCCVSRSVLCLCTAAMDGTARRRSALPSSCC